MNKLISVIIPVYNRVELLKTSLDSLLAQDYPDFEVIVVDDGSVLPIQNSKFKIQNSVDIQWYRQENAGAPAARNKGFELSKGDYVIFWDADVIAQPDMLSKLVKKLEDNPEASFAYSNHTMGSRKMPARAFDINSLKQCNFIHTTSLIRREDFVGWDENIKRFQDWDLWLSMLEQNKKGVWIEEYLFRVISGGTISEWLPRFAYKKPWKYLPWIRLRVEKYELAREIILEKHKI